jgi:CheY-like chemotaxis protein
VSPQAQILVAEDEPMLRELISESLSGAGYVVATAADGVEALALLDAQPGAQILISDIKMPMMDGYALTEEAIKRRPELKLLMMTGYAHDLQPGARAAREIRTLHKPLDMDKLSRIVFEMLSRP